MNQIGFLGAGNMGTAIIKGILQSEMSPTTQLYVFDPDTEKTEALRSLGVTICESEAALAQACTFLFLAIKPQMFETALPRIAENVREDTVIVSIAAGMTIPYIQKMTLPDAKVILVMPNTPLLLGYGATALAPDPAVSAEDFRVVQQIFDACGVTKVLDPSQMKEIIAINSSSPAFLYLYAKGFLDYAEKVGIDADTAKTLFAQTMIGAAKMITDSGNDIDTLIKQVSSPGGTTLAGLDALYAGNLTQTVENACENCTKRAYELSK